MGMLPPRGIDGLHTRAAGGGPGVHIQETTSVPAPAGELAGVAQCRVSSPFGVSSSAFCSPGAQCRSHAGATGSPDSLPYVRDSIAMARSD